MSTDERNVWISMATTLTVATVYVAVIVGRASSTPVEQVAWIAPMAWALGAIVAVAIVVMILAAIADEVAAGVRSEIEKRVDPAGVQTSRRKADSDERDKHIERHGDRWTGMVASVGVLAAIVVTMLGLDRFWIAQTLFAVIVLSSILGGVLKAVAYRRGI